MKNTLRFLTVLLAAAVIYSCGGSVGDESRIESSGSRPDWIYKPTIKDNQYVLVTGEMTKAKDRAFGMNQAYADGIIAGIKGIKR